jgi:hypothetical protein
MVETKLVSAIETVYGHAALGVLSDSLIAFLLFYRAPHLFRASIKPGYMPGKIFRQGIGSNHEFMRRIEAQVASIEPENDHGYLSNFPLGQKRANPPWGGKFRLIYWLSLFHWVT